MKAIWLGQAGLLLEADNKTVIIDPYLSNSVEKIEPHNKRRVAVDKAFLKLKPDIIALTHNHLDHTDPETLRHYITPESRITVLAPENAWHTLRQEFSDCTVTNNFVLFNRKSVWTEGNIRFSAVRAEHSDKTAVGIIISAEGKQLYITGDTLYNEDIFADLPSNIDYIFLPVNGRGNNMNMVDARHFCERIGARAVPLHCGLFDSLDMHNFEYESKAVPDFYKEIKL